MRLPVYGFWCTFVLLAPLNVDAEVRTWSDTSGRFQTEAELVDVQRGTVRLKKADGKIVSVSLDRLSAGDRAFVQQLSATNGGTAESATDALALSEDSVVIELISGARIQGQIRERDEQNVTIEMTVAGRTFKRKYPVSGIRAVEVNGDRRAVGGAPGATTSATASAPSAIVAAGTLRSAKEIDRLIDLQGRTPPEWWDATPVNHPDTLDLAWPPKPVGDWNARRNVGQYLWDIVHPNESKWHEGIRLIHFLLERHKDNPEKRNRAMNTLGRLYFLLLQDYARAAFWWRQAGMERGNPTPQRDKLAECYWRLGNKQMALQFLQKGNRYFYSSIKLLADMGETSDAIQLAESAARGGWPDLAYLHAGDACRIEGRYDDALKYYQKVLNVKVQGKEEKRVERNQQRARANLAAIRIYDMLELRKVPDGTYQANAPGYAGEVHVEVSVRSGRINRVRVTDHKEKQYYAALTDTPKKIIEKQGVKGVDATTGATITAEAIINATAKALADSMK